MEQSWNLFLLLRQNVTASTSVGYNKAEYEEFENATCTVNQAISKYYIEGGAQGSIPVGTCTTRIWRAYRLKMHQNGRSVPSSSTRWICLRTWWGAARLEHSYIDEFFLDQDHDPQPGK